MAPSHDRDPAEDSASGHPLATRREPSPGAVRPRRHPLANADTLPDDRPSRERHAPRELLRAMPSLSGWQPANGPRSLVPPPLDPDRPAAPVSVLPPPIEVAVGSPRSGAPVLRSSPPGPLHRPKRRQVPSRVATLPGLHKEERPSPPLAPRPRGPASTGPSLAPHASIATDPSARTSTRGTAVLPRSVRQARRNGVSSPPPPLRPQLPERYESVKELGVGAFGTVDLVRDNDIARVVARKRLKPQWHHGETFTRFIDEIKVIGQLEHPGIVPIYDVGLDEQGYFFVMKYVEGDTLKEIIARLRAGDPETVARYSYEARTGIFLQVLEALGFAHERGIVHRDLKPENIIVGRHGEVTVMDWGLAKQLVTTATSLSAAAGTPPAAPTPDPRLTFTQEGQVMGTPAYMSPEQACARDEVLDARSDLYSLTAVFYELMTLHHYLTPKATPQEMLLGVLHEEPLSAAAIHQRHAVPPGYTSFLRRGLSKDPAGRFQSAAEMAQALRQLRDGHPTEPRPCTGLRAVGNRWFDLLDAHPTGAAATAALSALCMVYGAYGLLQHLVRVVSG